MKPVVYDGLCRKSLLLEGWHQWWPYGEDDNGVACYRGDEWDKSDGFYHCAWCGARAKESEIPGRKDIADPDEIKPLTAEEIADIDKHIRSVRVTKGNRDFIRNWRRMMVTVAMLESENERLEKENDEIRWEI